MDIKKIREQFYSLCLEVEQLRADNEQFSIEVNILADILTSRESVDHAIADLLAMNKWQKIGEENERLKRQICDGANALSVAEETIANLGTATKENEELKEKLKEYGCHKTGCTANGPGGCNCGLLQAQGLLQDQEGAVKDGIQTD